jgi:hypothetical protein
MKSAVLMSLLSLLLSGSAVYASPLVVGTGDAAAVKAELRTAKPETVKLKECQVKEKIIGKRSTQMIQRAVKVQDKFTDIASKVDLYYTGKLVPKGKVVSNYAALKSDIAAKKAVVGTELAKSSADVASFSCAGVDPKGVLGSYKTDMMGVNAALKEYRSSIRNFTQALHQAAGDAVTPSPTATK